MTLTPGTRLGPYEVISAIGAGGMGEVYRARDTRLGREVAIKVLPAGFSSDPERLRRFELEARSASALSDPHIVTVHDVGNSGGTYYFASELVEGSDLRRLLDQGTLPPKKVLELAEQIASGLAAAHEKGIIHRDLKPENILLTKAGVAKIADFGLAKVAEPADGKMSEMPTSAGASTSAGILMGTAAYMSPEQAKGQAIGHRSDQFAFGSILYEMLTGRPAFRRASAPETLSAIIREDPEPVGALNPAAPVPLVWIVERCQAKDPEERYASTRDLARDLANLRSHLSGRTPLPAAALEAAGRSPRVARRLAALGLLAAGVALGLAGARWIWRDRPPAETPELHYLTYSGHDSLPSASPDGKTIAFVSTRDGRQRIWLKQLAGHQEVALTEGFDALPRFSPDGSRVLFVRGIQPDNALFAVPVVGGPARKLVAGAREGDWSPDGSHLVLIRSADASRGSGTVLEISRADGSERREIARFKETVLHARFSPDGRFVAVDVATQSGTRATFLLVDVKTGRIRPVAALSANNGVSAVAWNGSSREIVYLQAVSPSGAVVGSASRLIAQNIDTGKTRILLGCPVTANSVGIVGNGAVVFDGMSARENLREISLRVGDAQTPRWLTRGISGDRQPAYSPDGERIVFSSDRNGNLDLWELDRRSGAVRSLTDDAADDWDPAYTRDGKGLLWSSNRGGHFEIWAADTDGTNARQITHDGSDAENPTPTPDGNWIVYNSGNPAFPGVWKIRSDGSQATRLVAGTTNTPEISPDGNLVAYRTNFASQKVLIRAVRLKDGAPAPFETAVRGIGRGGRVRWMPGGNAIAFNGQDENGVWGVFVQDFIPGRDTASSRRRLGGFDVDASPESFGIAPDGSALTVAGWENLSSLLLADHLPGIAPPAGFPAK